MKIFRELLAKRRARRAALIAFRHKYADRNGRKGASRAMIHGVTPDAFVVVVHWNDTRPPFRSWWSVTRDGIAGEMPEPEDAPKWR